MKLLTKELLAQFKKVGSQEDVKNPLIIAKYFGGGSYSFYATEYDPNTKVFFGYVTGLSEDEWGYVSLEELEGIKFRPFGLGIERDLYFTNKHFNDIKHD